MTVQDLKNNRNLIIETATNLVGEQSVKEVMNLMVKFIDEAGDDVVAFVELIVEMYFTKKAVKTEASWKSAQSEASAQYMNHGIKSEY